MRRGEHCIWPEFKLFINLIYGRGRVGRVEQSWGHSPDSLTSWIFVIVPSRSAIKNRGVFGLVPPLEPWHAKYYAFISSAAVRLCGMLAGATDAVQAMQEFLHLSPLILACSEDWRPASKHLRKYNQNDWPRGGLQIISDLLSNSPRKGLHTSGIDGFIRTPHRNGVCQFMHNCQGRYPEFEQSETRGAKGCNGPIRQRLHSAGFSLQVL